MVGDWCSCSKGGAADRFKGEARVLPGLSVAVRVLWELGKHRLWDPSQNGISVLYFPDLMSLNLKRSAAFKK